MTRARGGRPFTGAPSSDPSCGPAQGFYLDPEWEDAMEFTVTMKKDRETKNAVRYQEVVPNDVTPPKIGQQYVQKAAFAELGHIPEEFELTVRVAG